MMRTSVLSLVWVVLVINTCCVAMDGDEEDSTPRLLESDRMNAYHARNYTWPIPEYVPNTRGWRNIMEERFAQLQHSMINTDIGDRYNGYLVTMGSALVVPNFTTFGVGLSRAPESLVQDLRTALNYGIEHRMLRFESGEMIDHKSIEGPNDPLFYDRPDLTQRVLMELHPYAEAWAGVELIPWGAYGFRLYREQSALLMHVDKIQSHVISFILHIDSHALDENKPEPWPLYAQDFHGVTHEVHLTSGDLLFYESAKILHGRPRPFTGSWYSSLFVHYYPKYYPNTNILWNDVDLFMEANYAVPPHWSRMTTTTPQQQEGSLFTVPSREELEVIGSCLKQNNCPNQWCSTQYAHVWKGPGEHGMVTTPDGETHVLNISTTNREAATTTRSSLRH